VSFKNGGTALSGCSAVALVGTGNVRTATCSTSSLAAGTYSIVGTYGGDAANSGSSSGTVSQSVSTLPTSATNVALSTVGAIASASTTASNSYLAKNVINGDRKGANWGNGSSGWQDATASAYPDWVQINFNGSKTITKVVVFSRQDSSTPVEPTDTMTFTLYGLKDFTVQGWNGSSWVTLGTVTGNSLVKKTVSFSAFKTDRIRVNVTRALTMWTRIVEIEAWGN
jgi:hypothetical protein